MTTSEALAKYAAVLRKWNRSIHLISHGDEQKVEMHIADAQHASRLVADICADLNGNDTSRHCRVVDVGAGGGFPGVVIAVENPHISVVAVEPIAKKFAFLRTVVRELNLPNFEPIRGRDDEIAFPAKFDVAISRATFELTEWLSRGLELVGSGGSVVGMGTEDSVSGLSDEMHSYSVDGRVRYLVVRKKV